MGLVDYEYSDDDSQDEDEPDGLLKPKRPRVTETSHAGVSGNSKQLTQNSDKILRNTCKYDEDEDDEEPNTSSNANKQPNPPNSINEGILRAIMTQGLKHTPITPQKYHEILREEFGETRNLNDSVDLLPSSDNIPHLTSMREKMDEFYKVKERIREEKNQDLNYFIQKGKEFRNPSIYEKLIESCEIDEFGTNYSKDYYDPEGWSKESYYDSSLYKQTDDKNRKRHKGTTDKS